MRLGQHLTASLNVPWASQRRKGKGKQRRDGQTERLEDTDTDSSNAQKREDVDFEEEFFMKSTDVPSYWFLVD